MADGAPDPKPEDLLAQARKGAGAEGARHYLKDLLWAKMWASITQIVNCPPDLNTLLTIRADIKALMKLAQEMQIDMVQAEQAVAMLNKLFTAKPRI